MRRSVRRRACLSRLKGGRGNLRLDGARSRPPPHVCGIELQALSDLARAGGFVDVCKGRADTNLPVAGQFQFAEPNGVSKYFFHTANAGRGLPVSSTRPQSRQAPKTSGAVPLMRSQSAS